MQFPSILAFVEGTMEQLFINNNFHYVEVIPVNNGVSWSVSALCQQIVTFYKARDANADAFVVWVDRERRSEGAAPIRDSIMAALVSAGAPPDRVHVLVCDMMTENVILADEIYIQNTFGMPNYKYVSEGLGGKQKLKEIYATTGQNYRETKHGVTSLKAIRLSRCAQTSHSVAAFLSSFQLPCWWVETAEV